jgi:putative PEP-CTERM system TPR-repeat lipoprotein
MTDPELNIIATPPDPTVTAPPPGRRARGRRRALAYFALALTATSLTFAAGDLAWRHFRKPADPMTQAQARLERGDPATARSLVVGVLKTRAHDPEALLLLGKTDLALGEPIAAEHTFRQAGSFGVDAIRLRRPLASALLAQHKAREALDLLVTDGVAAPEVPTILLLRANGLEQLHDTTGAEAALAEAARLAPRLIDVPLAYARLALSQHDLAAAERDADHALLINGRSTDALLLKAQVMEQRGERRGALDLLSKAATADPKDSRVRLERVRMLVSAGQIDEARTAVDALLADEPTNVMAIYLKAAVLIDDHDYAGADTLLLKIGRAVPFLPRGWYTVAKVKLNQEQLEQAAEAIEKYVERAPADLDGRKLRARIALASKRPGVAIQTLSPIIAAGTGDAETSDLIGEAEAAAGRFALAASSFSHAATLAPNSPAVQAHLGMARLFLGDSPGAVEALAHSLQLAPRQVEVGKQLVVAAVTAGKPDQAATFLHGPRQQTGETASTGQLDALLDLAQLDPASAADRLVALGTKYPDDRAIQLQLAWVRLMQGRPGDATTVLVGILAKEPANQVVLDLLIPLLERNGHVPRAAAILEAARAAAPGNLNLTLVLSGLYARAGDRAKALGVYSDPVLQHDTSLALAAVTRVDGDRVRPPGRSPEDL